MHTEFIGGELAKGHHRPRAALLGAGDDLTASVAVDLHHGPTGSAEARPPADCHADGFVVGQGLAVASRGRGRGDALLHADFAVDLSTRPDETGIDGVEAAEVDRVHAEGLGDLVGV